MSEDNKKKIQQQLQLLFDEDRSLTKMEYANLAEKINSGAIPVEYLRKNLFKSTMTKSVEYAKGRNKILYEDDKLKITVNRSLHLKHRDVLSILFMDNWGIKEKPSGNGEYVIRTNLYHIAKEMNYKKPSSSTELIKGFLSDLRQTELTFYDKVNKIEYGGHRIVGEYKYDQESQEYLVIIPATTAKKHILGYSVQIPVELNRKLLKIDSSLSQLKGLISYVLSNKALKNGITFNNLCEKLEVESASGKSKLKRMCLDNIELLKDFQIEFDGDILKYKQIEEIVFHSPVYKEKILPFYNEELEVDDQEIKHKMLRNIFKMGTIIYRNEDGENEGIIEDVEYSEEKQGYRFILTGGICGHTYHTYDTMIQIKNDKRFKPYETLADLI